MPPRSDVSSESPQTGRGPESGGAPVGGRSAWGRIRGALPWLLAAAILYLLFRVVPLEEAWAAAANARLGLFVPITLVCVVYWYLIESRVFAYLFSRLDISLSWKEARALRGVTYLFTPVNWNLGSAAMIAHLRFTKGLRAVEGVGALVTYGSFDILVLATIILCGALSLPASDLTASLIPICITVLIVQTLWVGLLVGHGPNWRWLDRVRRQRIFSSFQRIRARDIAFLLSFRAAYFLGFIVFVAAGSRAFGLELPLGFVFATTPIVMFAGALPFTPAGLGTQQAAMLYFFAPYGSEASILAFGLTFPVALILARIPLGLLHLGELAALRRHWQRRHENENTPAESVSVGAFQGRVSGSELP